jgi:dual specificity tyrosine-phosphorylation-regulated kinase 2/3/4
MPIDMWSLGCIICELYTGYPIFPGESEAEQIACMIEVKGPPPNDLIESSARKKSFFNDDLTPKIVTNSRGRKRIPSTRDLKHILRTTNGPFISFIEVSSL